MSRIIHPTDTASPRFAASASTSHLLIAALALPPRLPPPGSTSPPHAVAAPVVLPATPPPPSLAGPHTAPGPPTPPRPPTPHPPTPPPGGERFSARGPHHELPDVLDPPPHAPHGRSLWSHTPPVL